MVCVGLAVVAALQAAGVVESVDVWILAVATLFVDTTVRQLREGRFA